MTCYFILMPLIFISFIIGACIWIKNIMIFSYTSLGLFFIFLCLYFGGGVWDLYKTEKENKKYNKRKIEEIRYKRFTMGEDSITSDDLLAEHHAKYPL